MMVICFTKTLPLGYRHEVLGVEMNIESSSRAHSGSCFLEKSLRYDAGWVLDTGFPPALLWLDTLAGYAFAYKSASLIFDAFREWMKTNAGKRWMKTVRARIQQEQNITLGALDGYT